MDKLRMNAVACGRRDVAAIALFAVCAVTTAALGQAATAPATKAAQSRPVRVVGPRIVKPIFDDWVAQQAQSDAAPVAEYLSIDVPSVAVNHLLLGRELLLTVGPVNEKGLGPAKAKWSSLAPRQHLVAGRMLGIVVHSSSGVRSLTVGQVRDIFAGRINNWKSLGGADLAIKRYGTNMPDEFARLFSEKVLPPGRCAVITRKKNAAEVLQALGGDPQGIAYVDASEVATCGLAVRMVAIGDPSDPLLPNAQTVLEGTYPYAEALVLYVNPNRSEAAQRLADFILSEDGDAVCRKHDLMPGLKPPKIDLATVVDKLYGEDIKRVQRTSAPEDDIALARQLLASATAVKVTPELLSVICEAVFMLGSNAKGGEEVALEAMQLLSTAAPDKRLDCTVKRARLFERAYVAEKSAANGEALLDVLMEAADLATKGHDYAQAIASWKRAAEVAEGIKSSKLETITARMPAFLAREKLPAQLESLKAQLKATPDSRIFREQMLRLQLIELDNPGEAARFLDTSSDESLKSNVPLAQTDMQKLTESSSLKLAEWYLSLMDKASDGGRELMADRARSYYLRFFALHKSRSDALAMQAGLGLKKVGGAVPEPQTDVASAGGGPKGVTAPKSPPKATGPLTDAQLAQLVVEYPDITELTSKEIGDASLLRNLRPLERLSKLEKLVLADASQITEIGSLGKLTTLKSLSLTGSAANDFSPIVRLLNLEVLVLNDSSGLRDLGFLPKLPNLKDVWFNNCGNISSFGPLADVKNLAYVHLSNCKGMSDLSVFEKSAKLIFLGLDGCKDVKDLRPLAKLPKLYNLDVTDCSISELTPLENIITLRNLTLRLSENITQQKIDRLQKHLPDCEMIVRPALEP